MKPQETDEYHSYLLRVWQECRASGCLWRASLESAQTGELRNFTDLEALFKYPRRRLQTQNRINKGDR